MMVPRLLEACDLLDVDVPATLPRRAASTASATSTASQPAKLPAPPMARRRPEARSIHCRHDKRWGCMDIDFSSNFKFSGIYIKS